MEMPKIALMFDSENATRAVLRFLRDRKGHGPPPAAEGEEEEEGGGSVGEIEGDLWTIADPGQEPSYV